ncbi:MAG: Metallo-beta-lactamase superfamily protein [Pseudarthrobacter sp.]|nr:Metallo-beta-lactamase superfamily protein [Pseudarthrobacter sp.]
MAVTTVGVGVHRVSSASVNFYLIEGADGLTVIDSGLPGMWKSLGAGLQSLGRSPAEIKAVVLTHGHFDHLGLAHRLHTEHGIPVWVHPGDAYIARHPYRYRHEKSRLRFMATHPAGLPVLARMAKAGALKVKGLRETTPMPDAGTLPVPGAPEVIYTPGHTAGHCGLFLRDRNILFTGDALVTLDPYTGQTGPHVVAGAATANTVQNLETLTRFTETGAGLVLPGHGEPWHLGIEDAVAIARRHGPS